MSTRSLEVVYKWSEHVHRQHPPSFACPSAHLHVRDKHCVFVALLWLFLSSSISLPSHAALHGLSKFAPMFASSYAFSLPSVLNVFFVLRLSSAFTCKIRCYMPYRQVFSLLPRSCIWLFCQTSSGPPLCLAPALLPSCLRKYEW